MKVTKKNEPKEDEILAELIKERDKYQLIADEITKQIRKIVYKYDRN
jgi:hypothetical protein